MSDLKHVFSTFFESDSVTIKDHKTTLFKESVHKSFSKELSDFVEGVSMLYKKDSAGIKKIQESFQGIVPAFDMYKNDQLVKIEEKMVNSITALNESNLHDVGVDLQMSCIALKDTLIKAGMPVQLFEEFDNVDAVEQEMTENDVPQVTDGVSTETEEPASIEPEKHPYEKGFNEGRKRYKTMREQGLNARKMSQQIAESELCEQTYKTVEAWMRGFNEGCKFEESLMRETNPELFESEENA